MWILEVNNSRGNVLEWLQQETKNQNGVRSDSGEKCWVWHLSFRFQQVWRCSVSLWFLHKEKKWSDISEEWNNSSTHIHTRMDSLWYLFLWEGGGGGGFPLKAPKELLAPPGNHPQWRLCQSAKKKKKGRATFFWKYKCTKITAPFPWRRHQRRGSRCGSGNSSRSCWERCGRSVSGSPGTGCSGCPGHFWGTAVSTAERWIPPRGW